MITPNATPINTAATRSSRQATSCFSAPPTYRCHLQLLGSWHHVGWGPSGSWQGSALWPTGCSCRAACKSCTPCSTSACLSHGTGTPLHSVSPSSLVRARRGMPMSLKWKALMPTAPLEARLSSWCGGRATQSGKLHGSRRRICRAAQSC
jgi:hypothetical protein